MNVPATCYGFPCLHCDGTGKDDTGADCLWCGGTGEAPEDDVSDDYEPSDYKPEGAVLYDGTPDSGSWRR